MKKHFKRRLNVILSIIALASVLLTIPIAILSLIFNFLQVETENIFFIAYVLMGIYLMCIVITSISALFFPDFNYYIKVLDNSIKFEFPQKSSSTISRSFVIKKCKGFPRHIILEDKNTSIELYYSKKVLEFLNQIQK